MKVSSYRYHIVFKTQALYQYRIFKVFSQPLTRDAGVWSRTTMFSEAPGEFQIIQIIQYKINNQISISTNY
jgi:hypothetical protein